MITLRRMLEAAEREVSLRRRVYPNRIETGRMTPRKAAEEIAVMQAIADHLRPLAEAEEAKGRLL